MLKDPTAVVSWLRLNSIKNFEVRSSEGINNQIFESNPEDTQENKYKSFLENMSYCQGGRFIVYGYSEKSQAKGRFREEFASYPSAAVGSCSGSNHKQEIGIPDGYVSRSEMEAIMNAKLAEIKMQQMESELKELKKENKELQAPTQEFFRQLAPMAPAVISGLLGKKIPSQIGVVRNESDVIPENENNDENNIEENEMENVPEIDLSKDQYKLLMSALKNWSEADSDWIDILVKISNMVNDPMYSTAKSFLMSV